MARPSKSEEVDLSQSCRLTPGAIERLRCPAGKAQAFLRDKKGNGLRVRVTACGENTRVARLMAMVENASARSLHGCHR